MSITISCSKCGANYQVRDGWEGRSFRCKKKSCDHLIRFQSESDSELACVSSDETTSNGRDEEAVLLLCDEDGIEPPVGRWLESVLESAGKSPKKKQTALQNAIIDYVASNCARDPSLSSLQIFVRRLKDAEEKKRIQSRQIEQMEEARVEIANLDDNWVERRDQLQAARKELNSLAGELGATAFQAVKEAKIAEHPLLAERMELDQDIQQLERKCKSIRETRPPTLLEKGKQKVQLAVATSKMKLAELKIDKTDARIGKRFLDGENEEQLSCPDTMQILQTIASHRQEIRELLDSTESARSDLQDGLGRVSERLGRTRVDSLDEYDASLLKMKKLVAQNTSVILEMRQRILETAVKKLTPRPDDLGDLVDELLGIPDSIRIITQNEEEQGVPAKMRRRFARMKRRSESARVTHEISQAIRQQRLEEGVPNSQDVLLGIWQWVGYAIVCAILYTLAQVLIGGPPK